MQSRLSAAIFSVVLACCFTACPPPGKNDGGTDGGDAGDLNPPAMEACSGGCAANQVCDTTRRTCVDACGGCDAGICTKVGSMTYQCVIPSVTCGGAVCEAGQLACLGGQCSCLSSSSGLQDSCASQGKWCNGAACANPKRYEQCVPGSASCPTGSKCVELFRDTSVCVKDCSGNPAPACDRGEQCASLGEGSCLPSGAFDDCQQNNPLPDGGLEKGADGGTKFITVPPSNTCLVTTSTGGINDPPGRGTGNCTYVNFKTFNLGIIPISSCRPPGTAAEGQPCRTDFTAGTAATQCGTGLECLVTTGDQGICMRMCNANPPKLGFTPSPACGTGESCANLFRYTDPDDNAVVGVCMKNCNVFDPANNTCANIGSSPASCTPVTADGQLPASIDGKGVCTPQRSTIAALGAPCAERDAFKGASCASGQLCAPTADNQSTVCTAVCDLACAGANPPARCNTESNARCAGGKTCTRVTSTAGTIMGFCR